MLYLFSETEKFTFSNNLGITGGAFHENKIVHTKKIHSDRIFSAEVDNQTLVKEVRNFIIISLYAHQELLNKKIHQLNLIGKNRSK